MVHYVFPMLSLSVLEQSPIIPRMVPKLQVQGVAVGV